MEDIHQVFLFLKTFNVYDIAKNLWHDKLCCMHAMTRPVSWWYLSIYNIMCKTYGIGIMHSLGEYLVNYR